MANLTSCFRATPMPGRRNTKKRCFYEPSLLLPSAKLFKPDRLGMGFLRIQAGEGGFGSLWSSVLAARHLANPRSRIGKEDMLIKPMSKLFCVPGFLVLNEAPKLHGLKPIFLHKEATKDKLLKRKDNSKKTRVGIRR